jgi:parallel beta-helix repeat protein
MLQSTINLVCVAFFIVSLFSPLTEKINAQTSTHTFYISPNGNDTQCTGLSADAYPNNGASGVICAFKTIQRGANASSPGDTVRITPGTYNEKVFIPASGTATAPIIYMGYSAILVGTGIPLSTDEGLVTVSGKNYIRIQNLTITNSTNNGISVTTTNSIELTGNTVLNTKEVGIKLNRTTNSKVANNNINHVDYSSGIGVWNSEDIVVDNNSINTPHWYHECQGAHEEALSIANVNRFEIKNNSIDYTESKPAGYCSNAQRLGIDIKESSQNGSVYNNTIKNMDAAGIYVDGWHAGANGTPTLNHIKIYQNKTQDGGGIVVGCEQADGIVEYIDIYSNLVINSYFSGIQVRGAYGDGLRKNITIANNTIYGASQAGGNGGAGIYVTTDNLKSNNADSPVIIKNNSSHFYFLSTGGGTVGQIRTGNASMASKVSASNNIVSGPTSCSQEFTQCIEVGTRTTASPTQVFIDPTIFDFHVKAGSPSIDTGASVSVVTSDFEGNSRPQGNGYDIGAFEYVPQSLMIGNDYIAWFTNYQNPPKSVNGIDYVIWSNSVIIF